MRRKFIVAGHWWQANEYVRKNNFRINDFKIATRDCDVRGYSAEDMEFVLICNYWDNELYKSPIYKEYLSWGATEVQDDLHTRV